MPADLVERLVVERVKQIKDHLALGEVTIGPTYLQSIFTQIRYDRSKGQLSVTLRQNEAD